MEELFEDVLGDIFENFLDKILNVLKFERPRWMQRMKILTWLESKNRNDKKEKSKNENEKKDKSDKSKNWNEKKDAAEAEERRSGKREQEPFGIKHVLIALGCVALMAIFIHLMFYFVMAIVMMIVLAVGIQGSAKRWALGCVNSPPPRPEGGGIHAT